MIRTPAIFTVAARMAALGPGALQGVPEHLFVLVAVAALLAAPAAWGHHNFAAHYRQDEMIEISGVVREFRFVNPHVRIYLEVTADGGETGTWMAEGDASVALRRSGWTEDQLKPGDRVTIIGNPARSGANMLGWESVRLADGTDIGGGDGRVGERARIIDERLAEYRRQRDRQDTADDP